MPKYKIAFIHPDLGIGGAERLVLDVAITLAEKLNSVSFITNHFDRTHAFEELKSDKYPIHVIGDWLPRSICGLFQALCAYVRMIYLSIMIMMFSRPEDSPDVYFVDQIPMSVPFIKWWGGKVIYYCHHPDLLASSPGGILKRIYRYPINWLELKGTQMADVILVNSKYTESVFRKTFPQIKADIKILYPTISSSYQTNVNTSEVKNIFEVVPDIPNIANGVYFLSINRFHPAKKLELALDGLECLKSKLAPNDWNRVHLIMAGGYDPQSSINSSYFSRLVKLANDKGLNSKTTFLKSPDDDVKAQLLLSCDCLIYTPINEHFGIVPLEAMVASKPVIACNSGGPCETVEHGATGYLSDPTSSNMAEWMAKMVNMDKSQFKKMGKAGKDRLEKHFSHATFTDKILKVVAKACEPQRKFESESRSSVGHVNKGIPKIEECSEEWTNSSTESAKKVPSKNDEPVVDQDVDKDNRDSPNSASVSPLGSSDDLLLANTSNL